MAAAPTDDSQRASECHGRFHRRMLLVSAMVLAWSFVLTVRPDGGVGLPGSSWSFPETCMSRAWFGVSCPGCGLTRSFIHLAHGDLAGSLRLHRLGWLLAVLVAAQFPYRAVLLLRPEWRARITPLGRGIGWILIAALLVNWVVQAVERAARPVVVNISLGRTLNERQRDVSGISRGGLDPGSKRWISTIRQLTGAR